MVALAKDENEGEAKTGDHGEQAHEGKRTEADGDGDLDVLTAAFHDDSVLWFENDGSIASPEHWTSHTVVSGFDGAFCVASADMDADGDLDVVAGAYHAGDVEWFANRDGIGGAWTSAVVATDCSGVTTARPEDIDADGDLDILATGREADQVIWYENLASVFVPRTVERGFDGARSAVAVDWELDGDLDIIAAAEMDDAVSIWANLSSHRTAHFPDGEVADDSIDDPQTVEIADMDGDGDLDIVTGYRDDSGSPDISVLRQGAGSWTPVIITDSFEGVTEIRVGDINGDGAPDLLADAIYDDEVAWFENTGPTSFVEHTIATSFDVAGIDLADLDCDGDLDAVGRDASAVEVTWWENSAGDGSTWVASAIPSIVFPRYVRAGDVDGDADADLIVERSGEIWWWANDGTGASWTATLVDGELDLPTEVAAGDVDHDGDADLVAVDWGTHDVAVYSNLGGQTRVQTTDVAPPYLADASAASVLRFTLTSMGRGSDPDIELRRVELSLVDGAGAPVSQVQAGDLFAGVQIWHDADGNGHWGPGADVLLLEEAPSLPAPGQLNLEVPPGGDNSTIPGDGGWATYFVVLATTADATLHLPDTFRVQHQPGDSTTAGYRLYPTIPLHGEAWEPVTTRVITIGGDPSLIFADGFESGDTTAWSNSSP